MKDWIEEKIQSDSIAIRAMVMTVLILLVVVLVITVIGAVYGFVCLMTWIAGKSVILAIIAIILLLYVIMYILFVAEKKYG